MHSTLRKLGIITATALAVSLPGSANAAHWHGGYHGGYQGGWSGYGWGFGTGLALGLAAPYYGGYYDYYVPYSYYAGDCYTRRRWVIDRYGHRELRRVRVCY